MPSPARYTAAMAADPALPQSDMQEIAASRPDLLPALASNPALYPALREWLEQRKDPAVRAALAGRKEQSPSQPAQTGISPFAPQPRQAPIPSFVPTASLPAPLPATPTRSPLDDLLSEAPRVTPTLSDPFSHIPSVNGPEETGAKGRRVVIILAVLLVLILVTFGVYWFALRDDGAQSDSSATPTSSSSEIVTPTPEPVKSEEPSPSPEPTKPLKMPAPEGALNVSEFSSPTGNLQCQFTQNSAGQDFVKCTMWHYDFAPDVACTVPGAPLTYELFAEGPVRKRCSDLDNVADMPVAEYETSMAQNGFACTLETYNGFTCWSEASGKGFQIRQRWDRTF